MNMFFWKMLNKTFSLFFFWSKYEATSFIVVITNGQCSYLKQIQNKMHNSSPVWFQYFLLSEFINTNRRLENYIDKDGRSKVTSINCFIWKYGMLLNLILNLDGETLSSIINYSELEMIFTLRSVNAACIQIHKRDMKFCIYSIYIL